MGVETPQLMSEIDQSPQGRRIQLVRWASIFSGLNIQTGDQGTAISWTTFQLGGDVKQRTLQVMWDKGRDLSLVEGMDEWVWLDEQGET